MNWMYVGVHILQDLVFRLRQETTVTLKRILNFETFPRI